MKYFDKLETRSPQARERALMAALPKLIAHAKKNAPGFARILKGVRDVERGAKDTERRGAPSDLPASAASRRPRNGRV